MTAVAPRLISRTDVLSQLLATIAAVPAGQKLHVPGLRDALVNQADIIKGIETLIAAGELDAATLRPPAKARERRETLRPPVERVNRYAPAAAVAPAKHPSGRGFKLGKGEQSRPLYDALVAEGERRGLTVQRVSLAVWSNKARIYQLLKAETVRKSTADKIREWLRSSSAEPAAAPAVAVTKLSPAKEFRPTGAELAKRIVAEAERRGLTKTAACRQIFGNASTVAMMAKGTAPVRPSTLEKAEAWLAKVPAAPGGEEPPQAELGEANDKTPPPAPTDSAAVARPPSLPTSVSSAELADEIETFCAERSVTPSRIGRLAVGDPKLVKRLRDGTTCKAATAERVRSLLADPPPSLFRRYAVPREAAAPKPVRDVTRPPETPGLELADRQRLAGQRHAAQVRRGQEEAAAAKLDSGEAPKNSFERSLMAGIERRREEEARQGDPVEQAKVALRKRFAPVCSMSVYGGDPELFMVGSKRDVTRGELLLMAGIPVDVKPPAAPALPSRLKPAEMAWCDQCEQRVSGARAAKCSDRFCKLKTADQVSGGELQRQAGGQR